MKRVTSYVLAAALMLPVAVVAQSAPGAGPQGGPHARMGMGHRGMDMLQGLNLTDQQKTQLKTLMDEQRQKVQAIRQDSSLSEEQKRTQIEQLRKDNHAQVESILTPEQMAQLKQNRQRRGPGPMAGLNLSDEQKAQLQPIMEQQRQQMQSIRNDASLTPQQKRDKMRDLRQSTMSQMRSILTPEQQQQMQQWRKQRRGGRGPGGPGGPGF